MMRLSRWFLVFLVLLLIVWFVTKEHGGHYPDVEIEYLGPLVVAATPDSTSADPLKAQNPEFTSFTLTLHLGTSIKPGGGIRVEQGHIFRGRPIIGADVRYVFPNPEITDNKAPNYCSVRRKDAQSPADDVNSKPKIQTRLVPAGLGRFSMEAMFPEGLPEDAKVEFIFGDTSQGSPGLAVPTWPCKVQFLAYVDLGGQGQYEITRGPHPLIEVRAKDADGFQVTAPSVTRQKRISVRIVPIRGKAGLTSSSLPVRNFNGSVQILSEKVLEGRSPRVLGNARFSYGDAFKVVDLELPAPGLYRLQAIDSANEISGECNPVLFIDDADSRSADNKTQNVEEWTASFFDGSLLYWGSLQSHTALGGHAASTPDEAFRFARDEAALDFCALTDHSSNPAFQWEELRKLPDAYNEPGRFCALAGYEWTSQQYGHRHVIFRDGQDTIACSEAETDGLYEVYAPDLDALAGHVGNDPNALLVIHHSRRVLDPQVKGFVFGDPNKLPRQRLFEIFSWQGSSEGARDDLPINGREDRTHTRGSGFRDALDLGFVLGVTADSDAHLGRPGLAVGIRRNNGMRYGFSGLTAVLSPFLDRDSIFHGLETLRCYGTTGARILMAFGMDEADMGDRMQVADGAFRLKAAIFGTAPIASVELVSNNHRKVLERRPGTRDVLIDELIPHKSSDGISYFYLRVIQADDHMAWSTPIWVTP